MNTTSTSSITRRRFVGQAACAGIGSVPLFSTLLNLGLASRVAADSVTPGDDYRGLVCLFLGGGIDSFNMLVPRSGAAYNEYKTTRAQLALAAETLLPIGSAQPNHPELGLHPGLTQLKTLFDAGKLAFVSNVGSLVRPITLSDYNKHTDLPLSLFAHSNQSDQWMTCIPTRTETSGWAGRAGDILRDRNTGTKVSMNISLSGNNLLQFGRSVLPYSITPNGSIKLSSFDPKIPAFESAAVRSLLEQQYKSLFQQTYVDNFNNSIEAGDAFTAATESIVIKTPFPNNYIGQDLHMVARAIAAREALGLKRQTFFVERLGWDMHNALLAPQQEHLPEIAQGVAAFMAALEELGVADKVTLFTASEFGRTLSSNTAGTDHGWGGNHFVAGGAVKGGAIYGQYPTLALKSDLDTGQGRLIPTISVDTYSAEIARWFGVPDKELTTVFPNLGNFYSASSGQPPVGFMS